MRRREFFGVVGGAATWPFTARAQQPDKLPTIGFLGTSSPSAWRPWNAAFVRRLRELGWIEGQTVAFEYRWAEGRNERYHEFAAEFVRLKVNVIVTGGGAGLAFKQATSTIPVVLALASDPVSEGLVKSLARPGGNITGLSLLAPELASKRIGLLRELLPGFHRLAILANVGYPAAAMEMAEAQTAARTLGVDVITLEVRRAEDIVPALESLKGSADALYISTDPLLGANRARIHTLTLVARLPTIATTRDYAEAGSLMSYGPNYSDLFRRAAEYADKILHGTKPGDLPIEQPTKYELVINLNTARAIAVIVPPTLLARADEAIE